MHVSERTGRCLRGALVVRGEEDEAAGGGHLLVRALVGRRAVLSLLAHARRGL